jgi:hypothetical protein
MTIKEYRLKREITNLEKMQAAIEIALPLLLDCTKTEEDAIFLM